MEQRRLRLGDILDDYCPRERRVTNHAVVAMIDDDVKQTRCTTCDSEHAYKGGREPRRRKKVPTALYQEVLADMPETAGSPPAPISAATPIIEEPEAVETVVEANDEDSIAAEAADAEPVAVAASAMEEGPINRPLIRATLPRPEGQKDSRPLPDFTARYNTGRGQFRGDRSHRAHGGNGNGSRSHGRRFAGGTHGANGPRREHSRGGGGFRGGGVQQRHGGKKRSR